MVAVRSSLRTFAILSAVAGAHLAGCDTTANEKFRDLSKQISQLQLEKTVLEDRLAASDARGVSLGTQIENLRKQGLAPPAPVFEIDHIEILGITGGIDSDGNPGDDAVAVYIRPIDLDGDVIKREGQITVKLFDNSGPGTPTMLGVRVDNKPEQLRKLWYGKFWTNHYKVEAPFANPAALKPGQEVDVHVCFEDFLTGRTYTARRAVIVSRVLADAESTQ